jgi:hypothetical protein
MIFRKVLILMMAFTLHSTAFGQGSMGGNGGGTIECPGEAPVVLDYDEARSIGHPLLDLEKLSRKQFFDLMIERLKLGADAKRTGFRANMLGPWGGDRGFGYHDALSQALATEKTLDDWPEIPHWNVHDEFVEGNLRPGCKFSQAAISIYRTAYRIRGATERLSRGQRQVLELHEYLSQMTYLGTSLTVRELIGVLLRKKVDYATMRVAEYQFYEPMSEFSLRKHELYRASPEGEIEHWKGGGFADRSSLYALDLRGGDPLAMKDKASCPRWVGIVMMGHGNFVLQAFQDAPVEPDNFVLPWKELQLRNVKLVGEQTGDVYRRGTRDPVTGATRWDLELEQPMCERCGVPDKQLRYRRLPAGPECPYLRV